VSATVYTMRAIHRRHPDYRSGGESTVTDETSTTIDDVGSRSSASRYREVPSRSSALRFALAGFVALVLGALLVAWIAHDLHAANARDLPLNRWFHDRAASGGVVHSLSEWVSWIGAGERTVPIELAFAGVLLVARRWRWSVFLVVSSMGGLAIATSLKSLVGRPRPPWFIIYPGQRPLTFPSFPSGHTFAGIAGWVAMAIVLLFVLPRPWATVTATVVAVIGVANGPSRLFLGKHWVTDILGAWLLGSAWLLLVWAAFLLWLAPRRDGEPPPPGDRVAGVPRS